ncbi:MAG: DUF1232 domain-containing protein [Betaproteobacteria bacterium]|nr:DUF1232 domain-containing protein [Betaproteobacteria bacterium]
MGLVQRLVAWGRRLRRDVIALWFATRHPAMPLVARLLAVCVVAYALSPVDLIPDFIPVLGYLDEAVLLPLGIWLCLAMIPPDVLADCRMRADRWVSEKRPRPRSLAGLVAVLGVWLGMAYAGYRLLAD